MKIAYQGRIGAYSYIASKNIFPKAEYIDFDTFEEAMNAVKTKKVDYAVIPVENSNAGRVADVHFLLPEIKVYITGEYFLKIEHQLWGLKNAELKDIEQAYSHPQALSQCSEFLKKQKIQPIPRIDTAKSCEEIIELEDVSLACIASKEAGKINNLKLLSENIHNANNNTTRFLVMACKKDIPEYKQDEKYVTSFVFKLKNIPSALYKALGGFATNGVNITKIESYLIDGHFVSAQFYIEVMAHYDNKSLKNALEELNFFSEELLFLGCYKASENR
ncbi:MAG: prephenate dehydratase domain-containing protein [Alphaproteobacteria bacterium]